MATPKALAKQMTLAEFRAQFPDETACRDYLTARRWPEGARCPRSANEDVYSLPSTAHQ